jgi:PilZ domain
MFRSSQIAKHADPTDSVGIGGLRSFAGGTAEAGSAEAGSAQQQEAVAAANVDAAAQELSPEGVDKVLLEEARVDHLSSPALVQGHAVIQVDAAKASSVSVPVSAGVGVSVTAAPRPAETAESTDALHVWEREVRRGMNDSRTIVRVSREGSAETFVCQLMGAHELFGVMLTAPRYDKGGLALIREDEVLIFSTIYGTAAIKFKGTVSKLQFKPTPLIFVTPQRVDRRAVRNKPRVNACIQASIAADGRELPAVINDIGVGGLSVATKKSDHVFATGEQFNVNFSLSLLDVPYALSLRATVRTVRAELTREHPEISVAGVQIEMGSDLERLVTHAFVQERVVQDLGTVWRVLFAAR